jgi:GNAT superfamily N-acetyltransferase
VLAEANGEVVAVAISGPSRDDDNPAPQELYASYVRKAYQGSGVADALLDATIGDQPAALWVYRDNPRATAFYVNHGFIPDGGERTDSEGILEIRMVRNGGQKG